MADRHREKPLSLRLGTERSRVEDYAERHGLPVRRVILDAVREKLNREDTMDTTTDYCGCCGGDATQAPKGEHGECCNEQHDIKAP